MQFPLGSTANGKATTALLAGSLEVAFDRDEHTVGISAAGIAGWIAGGHVVAISVPAPTERFRANEKRIVTALHSAARTAPWSGMPSQ